MPATVQSPGAGSKALGVLSRLFTVLQLAYSSKGGTATANDSNNLEDFRFIVMKWFKRREILAARGRGRGRGRGAGARCAARLAQHLLGMIRAAVGLAIVCKCMCRCGSGFICVPFGALALLH